VSSKSNHPPQPLRFSNFGSDDPLSALLPSTQVRYLQRYFAELNAAVVVEEPNYFDRDYLAEFSAFYSVSAAGYLNICRRIHFFSDSRANRTLFEEAASGNEEAAEVLNSSYLGFIVIRPIPAAPLGRTVVRWYEDRQPSTPRITQPSREYHVNIAGFQLTIRGLAWQEQDTGVGACATIALWTMLHSSAFDDHHAIPTTADITRAAHKSASMGARMFPSGGLRHDQICEAIKEQNLAPVIFEGDIKNKSGATVGFSRERFASTCAALIRSGYPVLLSGVFLGDDPMLNGHAMCAVGFRSCSPGAVKAGEVELQESAIGYLYIHDDNIGPSVRFGITEIKVNGLLRGDKITVISPNAPPAADPANALPDSTENYPEFRPTSLTVAVHNDLRISPDKLHQSGMLIAKFLSSVIVVLAKEAKTNAFGVTVSTRFTKLADYVNRELKETIGPNPSLLGRVRLQLWETVPPMSLHLGLVRLGLGDGDGTPLLDILYDTTDTDRNHPVFAHIPYHSWVKAFVPKIATASDRNFGCCVDGF
jgi:hypothetical protein